MIDQKDPATIPGSFLVQDITSLPNFSLNRNNVRHIENTTGGKMSDQETQNSEKIASELAIMRLEKELILIDKSIYHNKAHPFQAAVFSSICNIFDCYFLYIG